MDQVALSRKEAFDSIRDIPRNLTHPQSVRPGRDAADLHTSRGKIYEKQHDKTLQP